MNCPKCGKENKEGSVFCVYCGAQLDKPVGPDATGMAEVAKEKLNTAGQNIGKGFSKLENNIGKIIKWLGKIEIVLGLACILIAIIAFIMYEEDVFYITLPIGIASLFAALPVIGFGQLVDDVHEIKKKL